MFKQPRSQTSGLWIWRLVQAVLVAVGISIVVLLFVLPKVGLILLWDVLIPAAPALLAVCPGLWRNICPLGTVSQFPRHLRRGGKFRASSSTRAALAGGSVLLLLVLVPARHVGLDDAGWISGLTLIAVGLIALAMGALFAGKSGWCSGLCPVHPVERLYGQRPAMTLSNAHCATCIACVEPCPDSTPSMSPLHARGTGLERAAGILMAGGFVGFVWGWYQVKPTADMPVAERWFNAYAWPLGAMLVSLIFFVALRKALPSSAQGWLGRCFAAGAVSVYYWYKLPALLGLGGSGTVLVDLALYLPDWSLWVCRGLSTVALFAWLVLRTPPELGGSWLRRPPRAGPGEFGAPLIAVSIGRAEGA
ncbi:MAG: ferredoxin [Leptolyngbya sp. PLA3]|nr:MAG: ferredoxin [Cyanobacteria bacterium CYA]MCE7968400.1 ferredoxin [Leptolyngbya sp. PL-A3]